MAEENTDIILSISSDVASMRRAQKRMEEMLNSMGRSSDSAFNKIADRANADMRRIEEGAIKLRRQLDATFQQSFGSSLNKGLAAVGSVLGTNEVRKYADQWTSAENMLKAATAATGMQTRSLKELRAGADDARVSVEDYVDLYARMVRSASGVAKSENEIALATNLVSKAFKAGGASAQEQAAGILQLGQALGSGVLQGDELRSLRENAPIVAKAIADEFGVTVAKLKDLGAEGKLTSDRVFRAIINAQKTIEAQFAATNATISDGMTAINNAMLQYIGTAGDVTGISATVSRALILISQNFDQVADAGMQLAAVLAGVLVGRSLGGMIRTLGTTTAALVKFHQAAKAAQGAMGLVQAMGGLGAAAGPLGAIIGGALVLAVGNYTVSAMAAQKNSDSLRTEMEKLGLVAPKAADGIDKAAESLDKLADPEKVRKLQNIASELERLRNGGGRWGSLLGQGDELDVLSANATAPLKNVMQNLGMSDADKSARREIANLISDFQNFAITADKAKERLQAINNTYVSKGVVELTERVQESIDRMSGLQAMSTRVGEMPGVEEAEQRVLEFRDQLENLRQQEFIDDQQKAQLQGIIDKLLETKTGAGEAVTAINSLSNANPSISGFLSTMEQAIVTLGGVYDAAVKARKAMAAAYPVGVPDEAKATSSANDPFIIQRKKENAAAADFEKNATRRAGLTKTQLDLETRLADVRKRLQAEGVTKPDEDMVRRIADAELAGEKARSAEGKKPKKEKATPKSTDQKIDSDIQAVKDRTEALRLEAEMVGKSTAEQEKRRIAMDLEQAALAKLKDEAIKKGQKDLSNIKISAEQRAQIDEVAEAYGREAAALQLVEDRQRRSEQAANDFYESFKSSTIGAITGANSLADALKNIGNRLAELFLNAGFDALFKPSSNGMSGGAFGDFFNSIGSLIGLKDGGQIPGYDSGGRIRGPGGPRDDKVLLWGSNGEFVMNAAATQKWLPVLEAMNNGKLPQLRNGGGVGFSAPRISSASIPVPSIPSVAQLSGNSSVDNSRTDNSVNSAPTINVNVDGGTGNAEVAAMVREGVQRGIMAWQRTPYFAQAVAGGFKQANKRGMLPR
ncbi:tape measure protein [Ochrobactrum intermedium]|uniref:tape measure protein n=1 Tax=Brucella intermedia TaxID=94625 RepID=UPI00159C0117|nr:tape measure protein [Brucella intermedia]NVM42775.1 tape measure protein [Brucella intermedia]UXO85488.1 tape measure protein [Brucella intermedia]